MGRALPPVDAEDVVDDVRGGGEAVGDELAAEIFKPGAVGCGDDDLAQVLVPGHLAALSLSRTPAITAWTCSWVRARAACPVMMGPS